jgi:hypothetical protein
MNLRDWQKKASDLEKENEKLQRAFDVAVSFIRVIETPLEETKKLHKSMAAQTIIVIKKIMGEL